MTRCTNCSRYSNRKFCERCAHSLAADGYNLTNDWQEEEAEETPKYKLRTSGQVALTPMKPPLSRRRRWFGLF